MYNIHLTFRRPVVFKYRNTMPMIIKNNMTQNNQNKTVVGDLVTVLMNCFRHGNRILFMSSLYLVVYWNILFSYYLSWS